MHALVKDIRGRKFGLLTPIEYVGKGKWKCLCNCGNETIARGADLRRNKHKSCGCLVDCEDLSERRFGKLIAKSLIKKPDKHGRQWAYWECTCDCGNIITTLAKSLKGRSTRSCGCLIGEVERGDVDKSPIKDCITKLRRARRAKGLCRCGGIPDDGFKMCNECRQVASSRAKIFRQRRLDNGLCMCGRALLQDRSMCGDCLTRVSANSWARASKTLKDPSLIRFCGEIARANRKHQKRGKKHLSSSDLLTGNHLLNSWDAQNGLCALSNLPMSHKFGSLETASIDRINSSIGYELSNIQLVCKWANLAKNKYRDEDLKSILNKIRAQGT